MGFEEMLGHVLQTLQDLALAQLLDAQLLLNVAMSRLDLALAQLLS